VFAPEVLAGESYVANFVIDTSAFDSDALFIEEGAQIVGSQSSLAVFTEPRD